MKAKNEIEEKKDKIVKDLENTLIKGIKKFELSLIKIDLLQ